VSPTNPERPKFWIVAGPNGSGKSSLYTDSGIDDFGASVWIINPDLLTVRIRDTEGLALQEANLQAVQRIQAWLEASIAAHQTVGVETVLSSPKYRPLVLDAKRRGFEVRLVYVLLRSVEMNLERIRIRVAKGGHDVPSDKVRDRRRRSLEQLSWFLENVDHAWLFDNSGGKPRIMATKTDSVIETYPAILPEIKEAIASIGTPG
jgi:predicted ABC-type ATPase